MDQYKKNWWNKSQQTALIQLYTQYGRKYSKIAEKMRNNPQIQKNHNYNCNNIAKKTVKLFSRSIKIWKYQVQTPQKASPQIVKVLNILNNLPKSYVGNKISHLQEKTFSHQKKVLINLNLDNTKVTPQISKIVCKMINVIYEQNSSQIFRQKLKFKGREFDYIKVQKKIQNQSLTQMFNKLQIKKQNQRNNTFYGNKCILNNNYTQLICVNNQCQFNAFVCNTKKCECKTKIHKNCIFMHLKVFEQKLLEKARQQSNNNVFQTMSNKNIQKEQELQVLLDSLQEYYNALNYNHSQSELLKLFKVDEILENTFIIKNCHLSPSLIYQLKQEIMEKDQRQSSKKAQKLKIRRNLRNIIALLEKNVMKQEKVKKNEENISKNSHFGSLQQNLNKSTKQNSL